MRFFRRQSSPAIVALLAVAMQAALLLAHAHVHPHSSDHRGLQSWAKTDVIACRAMVRPAHCSPAIPDKHDDCPLCWSLLASGAGVLPTALGVTAATVMPAEPLPPLADAIRPDKGSAHFQARAPPARLPA